jgi:nucleoside-diphosphate-sugar epimerase
MYSLFNDDGWLCRFVQVEDEKRVSSKRLQALGWKFRAAEETLRETIDSYKAAGILN